MVWDIGPTRLSSLICYDDTVPRPSEQLVAAGAETLVTLSNETWFRDGELDQHLALSTFRCIETRRPLARSSNPYASSYKRAARVPKPMSDADRNGMAMKIRRSVSIFQHIRQASA